MSQSKSADKAAAAKANPKIAHGFLLDEVGWVACFTEAVWVAAGAVVLAAGCVAIAGALMAAGVVTTAAAWVVTAGVALPA
jgi:hypothetical protein